VLTEKQLNMNILIGNVLEFVDDVSNEIHYGWVIEPTDEMSVIFTVQVIDQKGVPFMDHGVIVEGQIGLNQVKNIVSPSLDHFKRGVWK
jgi:hypothetical protein